MVSDELMGKVVMAGIPKWCCARLRAYQEVGMGLPLLYQVLGRQRPRASLGGGANET